MYKVVHLKNADKNFCCQQTQQMEVTEEKYWSILIGHRMSVHWQCDVALKRLIVTWTVGVFLVHTGEY